MGLSKSKEKKLENKALKDREEAINRQRYYELYELRQTWSFVFGEEIPKKKKEVLLIKDVTPRDCWMETNYIFNQIVAHRPDEMFHDISDYALKWSPPGSRFKMMIPLDDPAMQESIIIKISWMPKPMQKRLLFFFAPKDSNKPMFAPKVHPASLVSYRQRNQVLEKLCEQFLQGRMEIDEFQSTLGAGYDVWKLAMYNMLPEDEQEYHTYLLKKPEVVRSVKAAADDYLNEKITLMEYHDLKYPERKKAKDIAALTYPRPYPTAVCTICKGKDGVGIINCHICTNKVCVACVKRVFLDEETKQGSFLLIHRRYCLSLGLLKKINPIVQVEPGYLRELRATGRSAALARMAPFMHAKEEIVEEEQVQEEDDDEEERYEAEQRRLREIAEHERMMKECPPELQHLQHVLVKCTKKYEKMKKEILEHQRRLDEPGHTEMFEARLTRLRNEAIELNDKTVLHDSELVKKGVIALDLQESKTAKIVIAEAEDLIRKSNWFKEMTSVDNYHELIDEHARIAAEEEAHRLQEEHDRETAEALERSLPEGAKPHHHQHHHHEHHHAKQQHQEALPHEEEAKEQVDVV